jgi:hypothetical protein
MSCLNRAVWRLLAAVGCGLGPPLAHAVDLTWSGFATVGYAQSDRDFQYLRWIDDGGTFNANSVAGLQLDVQLAPRWSVTAQLRAAPATDHDSRWDVEPSWAFAAWRPADGLLLRAGRLRTPLYLYSEVLDVGVAHDMARLPVEMYSLAPTDDVIGVSASYDWMLDENADYLLNVTLFYGNDKVTTRGWVPNGVPGILSSGASFLDTDAAVNGLVFDLTMPDSRLRASVFRARADTEVPTPKRFPRVDLAPGLGYYKVDPAFPGPPITFENVLHNDLYTLGAEHRFAGDWRVAAEYARIVQHDADLGSDSHGGYLALFRQYGRATHYVSFGRLKSTQDQLDIYRSLVANPLPPNSLGGAEALINAAQEAAAVQSYATDQRTLAIGSAVDVPGGKLKWEWAHSWVNDTSRLIDERPADGLLKDRQFNVWTISYSVGF